MKCTTPPESAHRYSDCVPKNILTNGKVARPPSTRRNQSIIVLREFMSYALTPSMDFTVTPGFRFVTFLQQHVCHTFAIGTCRQCKSVTRAGNQSPDHISGDASHSSVGLSTPKPLNPQMCSPETRRASGFGPSRPLSRGCIFNLS